MKTVHMRYTGKRLRMRLRVVTGRISATRPCLSRILMEWMIRWVLVSPRTALGLRLKTPINPDFKGFGVLA